MEFMPVQVVDLQLLKLNFELLAIDDDQAEPSEDISFEFECSEPEVDEDGATMAAYLSVTMTPGEGQEDAAFAADVKVRGILFIDDDAPMFDPSFVQMAKTQLFQQLYGFVRAQLQNATAVSPLPTYLLPLMAPGNFDEGL